MVPSIEKILDDMFKIPKVGFCSDTAELNSTSYISPSFLLYGFVPKKLHPTAFINLVFQDGCDSISGRGTETHPPGLSLKFRREFGHSK
jgi:hypothetical protein